MAAPDVAETFLRIAGDEVDKFARCAWSLGPLGVPILDACPAWFAGAVRARHDLGDHVGYLLEPLAAAFEDGKWLSVQDARHIEPGHPA